VHKLHKQRQLKDLVCCIANVFKFVCVFCSLIGATIISIGFYTVMWGKAQEEVVEDVSSHETQTTQTVPLLQSYETDRVQKKMDANV
jgi:hypothetical protein